jgi:hypothetical protein
VNVATVNLPVFDIRADIGAIDEADRSIEISFSTGAAVDRIDYYSGKRYREVLSMKPGHVRLQRLNAAGPLLDTHSVWSVADVFGAVVEGSARLEKGVGLARVRFSKRDAVEPYWQDVKDRIIRSVSTGYKVYKFIEEAGKDGTIPTRTAVDWEPFEVSMVPMPADIGARFRSGEISATNPCVIETRGAITTDADRMRRFRLALARAAS